MSATLVWFVGGVLVAAFLVRAAAGATPTNRTPLRDAREALTALEAVVDDVVVASDSIETYPSTLFLDAARADRAIDTLRPLLAALPSYLDGGARVVDGDRTTAEALDALEAGEYGTSVRRFRTARSAYDDSHTVLSSLDDRLPGALGDAAETFICRARTGARACEFALDAIDDSPGTVRPSDAADWTAEVRQEVEALTGRC